MKKPTILFVDDDLDLLRLGAALLENEGFHVTMATSAEEAARTAFATFPDLVITDVMMPGESGYSLCERLRSDRSTRDTPVIFLTCMEGEHDAMEAGASAFLSKPLDPTELTETVKSVLSSDGDRDPLDEALELVRQERFEEAFTCLGALAEAHEGQHLGNWAAYHRACLFERIADTASAARAHRELLKSNPSFWRSHVRMGALCRKSHQNDKAMRHFRRALVLQPDQPDVRQDLELLESIHRQPDYFAVSGESQADTPTGVGDFGAADQPTPISPPRGSRGEILVADDDPDVTNLMAVVLRASGFAVRVVHDGKSALEAVRERRPDMVLLDGLMPGANGFDTALAIKTELCPDDPPKVALITAVYTKLSQRQEAKSRYKVDVVVEKPITPQRLLELVESLVDAPARTSEPELVGATT